MRVRTRRFMVLLAGLTASTTAPADPPQRMEPIKPWVLDYAATQCDALREYGEGDQSLTFAISPSIDGETYRLLIACKVKSTYVEELDGSIDFGTGPIAARLLEYPNKNRDVTVEQFQISAKQFDQIRSAKAITLSVSGKRSTVLAIDDIAELTDKMEDCRRDLRDYWNMDGAKAASVATPPQGDIRRDFDNSDYPGHALKRGQQGTDVYLLMVDETGKIAGCDVVKPSGVPVLDAMGCAVIQERTLLQPGRDADGKPVRSTLATQVAWRLND